MLSESFEYRPELIYGKLPGKHTTRQIDSTRPRLIPTERISRSDMFRWVKSAPTATHRPSGDPETDGSLQVQKQCKRQISRFPGVDLQHTGHTPRCRTKKFLGVTDGFDWTPLRTPREGFPIGPVLWVKQHPMSMRLISPTRGCRKNKNKIQ